MSARDPFGYYGPSGRGLHGIRDDHSEAMHRPVPHVVRAMIARGDDEGDIPEAPSRIWPTLPYLIGAAMSLLLVYAWLTPHPAALRIISAAGTAATVAAMLLHQSATVRGLYLSNAALSLANHRLATINEHLHLLATTDPLTGLPNRTLFHDRMQQALAAAAPATPVALLLFDLNHFKEVNDTFGHQAGDCCKQVAVRLRELGARAERGPAGRR